MSPLSSTRRLQSRISWIVCWVLSGSVILPIEIYIGGVFLRPVLLATLIVGVILALMSLRPHGSVKFYHLNRKYLFCIFLLSCFFILQTGMQDRIYVGIKETIELLGTISLAYLLVKISREIGLLRTLFIFKNVTFLGSLLWVFSNVIEGNVVTYKDPYWILLMATLLNLISVKFNGAKSDYIALSILLILDILSASRTLWMTCFVFVFVVFGSKRLIIPSALFVVSLVGASVLNPQYSFYWNTLLVVFNNFSQLITDTSAVSEQLSNVSDKVRILEAVRSVNIFLNNPFMGVGLDNYQDYITLSPNYSDTGYLTPHNEFLRVAAEGGTILLFIYFCLYRFLWNDISLIGDANGRLVAQGLLFASLTLAFFTATNYTIHFLLQLSLMCQMYFWNKKFTDRETI